MSIRATTWVMFESESRGNDRLVLLMIADEADDDGRNAFPSVERIALKARVNRATVMRSLTRLEAAGELLVRRPDTRGRGRHNRYTVVMGRDPDALAGSIGWPAPALDPAVREEWSHLATDEENPGDDHGADHGNGPETSQNARETRAPGATRPYDPLTQGSAPEDRPHPRRRGLDRPPEVVEAERVAAAERANIARSSEAEHTWVWDDDSTPEDRRARLEQMRRERDADADAPDSEPCGLA